VIVNDAPPAFSAPSNVTTTATSTAGAVVEYTTPAATDFKDGSVTVSCSPQSLSTFPIGATTVNCSATNSDGMVTNRSFTVTVNDAAPVFDAPANITAPATSADGAVVSYALPIVTDFADGSVTAVCTPASGTLFAVGTTTVNCTATNSATMTTSHSFTVTVTPFVAPPPPVPGATPAGADISVSPTSDTTITFANVTSPGITSVTPIAASALPPLADGFALFGQNLAFEISTTATLRPGSAITVCFAVPSVSDAATFATLRVLHRELGVMADKTSRSDFATRTVCAEVTSLSPFAIGVVVNRLGKFVAFSDDSTWLGQNSMVVSGDVGANARNLRHAHDADDSEGRGTVTVRVGERVSLQQAGSRVVGDVIRLDERATVYSLVYNTLMANKATVLGTKTPAMAIPFLTMPAMHEATPGKSNVEVSKGRMQTLAAGAYGKVHVAKDGTLILTGGTYQIRSLDVDQSATVIFRGATEIRIATELDTDNKAKMILDPAASGLKASDVVFYVGGDDNACAHDGHDAESGDGGSSAVVHVGENNVVQANIYAPRGTVRIKSKTQATGAFVGEHVRVGQNVTLKLDSAFQ
jgi:PKD repeat protein